MYCISGLIKKLAKIWIAYVNSKTVSVFKFRNHILVAPKAALSLFLPGNNPSTVTPAAKEKDNLFSCYCYNQFQQKHSSVVPDP